MSVGRIQLKESYKDDLIIQSANKEGRKQKRLFHNALNGNRRLLLGKSNEIRRSGSPAGNLLLLRSDYQGDSDCRMMRNSSEFLWTHLKDERKYNQSFHKKVNDYNCLLEASYTSYNKDISESESKRNLSNCLRINDSDVDVKDFNSWYSQINHTELNPKVSYDNNRRIKGIIIPNDDNGTIRELKVVNKRPKRLFSTKSLESNHLLSPLIRQTITHKNPKSKPKDNKTNTYYHIMFANLKSEMLKKETQIKDSHNAFNILKHYNKKEFYKYLIKFRSNQFKKTYK